MSAGLLGRDPSTGILLAVRQQAAPRLASVLPPALYLAPTLLVPVCTVPCSLPRCRLVINGGEFEAMGVGHAGPRGDKKARQHAALQVLHRLGYNVSFDAPTTGGHGGGGGYAPQGGPGPAGGYGRDGGPGAGAGPGGRRYERGRTLDARAAAAAAQQQNPASRSAYLASLQDELG